MAEEAVTEVVEPTEAQAEADFEAGFKAQDDKSSTEKPADTKPETPSVEGGEAATPEAKEAEAKKEALIAGMTEADWNAAVAKGAGPIAEELRAEIRKTFGKIGEINTAIKQLQGALAAGKSSGRKITPEMLKRVSEELPGLGEALAADLSEALGGVEAAQAKAEEQGKTFDAEAFFKDKVAPALEQFRAGANRTAEERLLRYAHPDYLSVIYADPKEGRWSPQFETWVKTQPAERQAEIQNSEDAIQVAGFVTEYKAWAERQKKEKERSKTRLEGAITPKGVPQSGGPTVKDDDALFEQGFKEASKKYAR